MLIERDHHISIKKKEKILQFWKLDCMLEFYMTGLILKATVKIFIFYIPDWLKISIFFPY